MIFLPLTELSGNQPSSGSVQGFVFICLFFNWAKCLLCFPTASDLCWREQTSAAWNITRFLMSPICSASVTVLADHCDSKTPFLFKLQLSRNVSLGLINITFSSSLKPRIWKPGMSETLYGLWEPSVLLTDKSGGGGHQKMHHIQAGMGSCWWLTVVPLQWKGKATGRKMQD